MLEFGPNISISLRSPANSICSRQKLARETSLVDCELRTVPQEVCEMELRNESITFS